MKTILSIDCGTQSLRAMIFNCQGAMLAKSQVDYEPYISHQPGWAEQDPEIYWQSLVQACQQLKTRDKDNFKAISGIGVTTQRASMINLDENGKPLRPAILWMDQRRSKMQWGHSGMIGLGLGLLRLKKKIEDIQTRSQCNWIMQEQPDLWAKTAKYVQVSGFLNFRLTGHFSDSIASQIGYLPFDYKKQQWAKRYSLTRMLFPVDRNKLPDLVVPGKVLGKISSRAADETGLKKEIPVIACGSDKGCETLGAGVVNSGTASLSFGTTATVQTLSDIYLEPIKYMPSYPAVIPGKFNPEIEIFRGFWMVSWFKKQFAHKEVKLAKEQGIPPEELLNQSLKRTKPGAMGLILQPYWGPGLGHPEAKGAMIGFGDVHSKDHIYRSLIEGLGFALREGLEILEQKTGKKIGCGVVSGGASQSDEICKITADIFNRPIRKGQTHETSGLGAAIIIAAGMGWFGSLDEAVTQMVHEKKVFHPDNQNVRLYDQLYSGVYSKMYKVLEPFYERIRKITGYPKK